MARLLRTKHDHEILKKHQRPLGREHGCHVCEVYKCGACSDLGDRLDMPSHPSPKLLPRMDSFDDLLDLSKSFGGLAHDTVEDASPRKRKRMGSESDSIYYIDHLEDSSQPAWDWLSLGLPGACCSEIDATSDSARSGQMTPTTSAPWPSPTASEPDSDTEDVAGSAEHVQSRARCMANDSLEVLAGLLSNESIDPPETHEGAEVRLQLADFISSYCKEHDFSLVTTGLALHVGGRVCCKLCCDLHWSPQLVGIACVWLASKYHNWDYPDLDALYEDCSSRFPDLVGSCTPALWQQKVRGLEKEILYTVGFALEVGTLHSFAHVLIRDLHDTDLERKLRDVLAEVTKLKAAGCTQQTSSVLAFSSVLALLDQTQRSAAFLSRFKQHFDEEAVLRTKILIAVCISDPDARYIAHVQTATLAAAL